MTSIDREKLSGLLDGELPSDEAEAVRRALREDPALGREYEELAALDAQWKAEARAAAFDPSVTIPHTAMRLPIVALAVLLVLLRCLLKAVPPIDAGFLEAIVLIAIVAWTVSPLLKASESDLRRLTERVR